MPALLTMPAMEDIIPQMEGEKTMQPLASQPIIHCHRHNLKNRFDLIKTLGEGTYGKVKLAVEHTTGEKVAIKYIRKKKIQDDQDLTRIRREIKVMAKLQHPHIINVREVFENREKIVMVMDFASGGELYDYINSKQRLDDRDARRIFRQIVSAVHYCHQNGVVHRDLKLENIVLDDNGNVRIADFGLSNFYGGQDLLTTYCGSPLYAAPEIVNGIPYRGPEVDNWSLGVLLYTLVYGTMPFDGKDFKTLRKQISSADYFQPLVPSDAAGLIEEILTPNPEERANMNRISNHWWVNVGFSTTPTGTSYDGQYMQTQHPQFSILNFLSNSHSSYRSKNDLSAGEKNHRSYASCDMLNSNHFAEANSFKMGAKSEENVNSKWPSEIQSDDSDTLSNYSLEETKMDAKPTRSILKKRGKFSISDSGCGLEEDACSARSSGPVSPVMSDLSYELCDIQSVLDKESISDGSISKDEGLFLNQCTVPASETEQKTKDNQDTNLPPDATVSKVLVRRGILKRPKKSGNVDDKNRNSLGSQGSNSSSDLLDFSYDSADQLEAKYSLTITKLPDSHHSQQQLKSKYMYSPTGTRQPEFDFSSAKVKQYASNYSSKQRESKYMYSPTGTRQPEFDFSSAKVKQYASNHNSKQCESNYETNKPQSAFSAAKAKLLEIENSVKQTEFKHRPKQIEYSEKSAVKTKTQEVKYSSQQLNHSTSTKPPKPNYRVTKKITLNPAPSRAQTLDNGHRAINISEPVHKRFASMSLLDGDFQTDGAIEDCDLQEARDVCRQASQICSMKTL